MAIGREVRPVDHEEGMLALLRQPVGQGGVNCVPLCAKRPWPSWRTIRLSGVRRGQCYRERTAQSRQHQAMRERVCEGVYRRQQDRSPFGLNRRTSYTPVGGRVDGLFS